MIEPRRDHMRRLANFAAHRLSQSIAALVTLSAALWGQTCGLSEACEDAPQGIAFSATQPDQHTARIGREGGATEALRRHLADFPIGEHPGYPLAPIAETQHGIDAGLLVPVPDGMQVFPGKDGVWLLSAEYGLTLIEPEGTVLDFPIQLHAKPVGVTDLPDGPHVILADLSVWAIDLPSLTVELVPIGSLFVMAGHALCNPSTECIKKVSARTSINLRGEMLVEFAAWGDFGLGDSSRCLGDDGRLSALVYLASTRRHWDDDSVPVGCRADPSSNLVIKGFFDSPGSAGGRTNYDLIYAHEPGETREYVSCLDLGSWQDVDVARGSDANSLDLALTDGVDVRLARTTLIYEFVREARPTCVDIAALKQIGTLRFSTPPRFARLHGTTLMVYLPEQNEIQLVQSSALMRP